MWSPVHHDDVIKWNHFPRYWPFVLGIHRSPMNSPHKGQWRRALRFSLICTRINGWVNNGEAGDLRCYRVHYEVTMMISAQHFIGGMPVCFTGQNSAVPSFLHYCYRHGFHLSLQWMCIKAKRDRCISYQPLTKPMMLQCYIAYMWVNSCDEMSNLLPDINSSPPSATYMHQWIRSALVQIMAWHWIGAKPLSKPVLGFC